MYELKSQHLSRKKCSRLFSKGSMLRGKYDEFEARINEELAVIDQKKEELEAKKKELEDAIKDGAIDAVRRRIGF